MERIEKIKEMLAANPSDSFLLHALGLEYIKIGELNLAKQSFERVLVSNLNYIGTYYNLAKVN
jgi:Tfp pilus assembly protein PilF